MLSFIVYLNVPSYVASAASVLSSMAWVLKIFFALLSDTKPINGFRRRPYMMLGWSIAVLFLLALACTPLPDAYYCKAADGSYDMHKVCNAEAQHSGYVYALLMMMVSVGVVLADVSADALTVTYARREPLAVRGQTQTTAYLVREIGGICAKLLVGFGMNGKEYNGSFPVGLSFSAVCGILAVPALLMVPISWFLVPEVRVRGNARSSCCCGGGGRSGGVKQQQQPQQPRQEQEQSSLELGSAAEDGAAKDSAKHDGDAKPDAKHGAEDTEDGVVSMEAYWSTAYGLMSSGAMFEVLCYQYFSGVISGIGTTAGSEVQRVWANVQNLQAQLFGIAGGGSSASASG